MCCKGKLCCWHFRKTAPPFSTLCLIYARFVSVLQQIYISASLLSIFNSSNLTTSWSFIQSTCRILQMHLAACICMCLCCAALHHLLVTDNHTCWYVFHLQTPAWGWQAVQVCSHLKVEQPEQLGCSGGGCLHTSSRNFSIVLCIEKKNVGWFLFCLFSLASLLISSLKKHIKPSFAVMQDVINPSGM